MPEPGVPQLDGPRRRRRRSGGRWLPALVGLTLVSAGCGSRTSADDVRALWTEGGPPAATSNDDRYADSGAPVDPAAPATSNAAPAAEAGSAPASSAAGSFAAPSGAAGTSAGRNPAAARPGSRDAAEPGRPAPAASGAPGGAPGRAAAAPTPGTPAPPGPGSPAGGGPVTCSGSEPGIVIGSAGTQSGVLGEVYRNGVKAVQAWVASVNARGGVNCHRIKHIVGDDGGDPARHLALVRRFVEEDKVVVFVFNNAPQTGQSSADYLTQKQVPVIGQEGGQFFFYSSPVHFPVAANAESMMRVTVAAAAAVAIPQGKTKVSLLTCQEVEYCNIADKVEPETARALGFTVVGQAKGSITQPDFTAQCLQARNAGAEVIFAILDGNSLRRLASSCAKVDYHPILAVEGTTATANFLEDPNMDGTVVGSPKRPWFLTDHPAIAEYQGAIRQFAVGQPFDASGMDGWESAKVFEHIVKRLSPTQAVTSKDVIDGAYSLNGYDADGLVYPLRFERGKAHKKVACGWAVSVAQKKWKSDGKMFCVKGHEP